MTMLERCRRGHVLDEATRYIHEGLVRCRKCRNYREAERKKIARERNRAPPKGIPYADRVEYMRVAKFQPDDVICVFPAEYLDGVEAILRSVLAHTREHNDTGIAARFALAAIEAGRKGWDRWQPPAHDSNQLLSEIQP